MTGADLLLVRFAEIGIKRGNRKRFTRALADRIRETTEAFGAVRSVRPTHSRILVELDPDAPAVARRRVLERLTDTPGVHTVSPAHRVAADMEALAAAVADRAEQIVARRNPATFRITCSRSDKRFPLTSDEIARELGGAVLARCPGLRVQLKGADLEIGVEIATLQHAYVYAERLPGPGGVPVGTAGGVVHLLSGGFDSPVAGSLLQVRGCELTPIYFHSFPLVGDAAREKVIDLARILSRRQRRMQLGVVGFTEVQTTLRDRCPADLLVVLYRRMMLRVADAIAERLGFDAVSTGDALSQVASQTLPNLRTIQAVCSRPVLRPLLACNKEQIIDTSRRLGMFEISARRADDCCSLFVPRHPRTRARIEHAERAERGLDIPALVAQCLERTEWIELSCGRVCEPEDAPRA
ncbi:MAG: tRNA 4-thiouridine(8) synthase ThiI [Planctomycetota bacterium]|nr:MAG: tRNA 4-thiouridine(8) synthase ThiI [Planctomycetota bacterium]